MSAGPTPTWLVIRAAAARPRAVDRLVALLAFGLGMVGGLDSSRATSDFYDPLSLTLAVLAALVLLARRRRPVGVLAVTVSLVTVGWISDGRAAPTLGLAMGAALYTVTQYRRGRIGWHCAAGIAVFLAIINVLSGPSVNNLLSAWSWVGFCAVAGYSVRGRRDYVAAVEDRAIRAEQGREQEAWRQVTEERLRIARELHDVVGHHIALINVQSAVVEHVLTSDPGRAAESLGHVRRASRMVLDELSSLVRVLRDPDEPVLTRPARGLAHLDKLVESFLSSGLPLACQVDGRPRPLPALVDLAAYRIIQESLTNAYKHGRGGRASVRLTYDQHELRFQILNSGAGRGRTNHLVAEADIIEAGFVAGHGITGMRERAAALDGRLRIGRTPDDSFVVSAQLPLPPQPDGNNEPPTPTEPAQSTVAAAQPRAAASVRAESSHADPVSAGPPATEVDLTHTVELRW